MVKNSLCVHGEYAERILLPTETAQKVSKHIRRIRRKYLSVDEECGKLGLFAVHKIVSDGKYLNVFGEYAETIYAYMEMMQRGSWRILLIHQET
jgi:hypothetical protein